MSRQSRPKQIQNSNFQMFKQRGFFVEYDFLCFGHLRFRNSVIVSNFDLPAIARDLPAIAVCAGIADVRRPWRWQAGAGT
jgi:hypothetical protein